MNEPRLLYKSAATAKSLWQEYRIYEDHLELDLQIFGTLTVPFHVISAVNVRPRMVVLDFIRGKYPLADMFRTVKLDMADLMEHVTVEKNEGFWKQLRITPDNPEVFKQVADQALQTYLKRTAH